MTKIYITYPQASTIKNSKMFYIIFAMEPPSPKIARCITYTIIHRKYINNFFIINKQTKYIQIVTRSHNINKQQIFISTIVLILNIIIMEQANEQKKDFDIEVLITMPKNTEKPEPRIIKEVDEKGEIVSIPLKDSSNQEEFMTFDKNLNPLENFWKNFVQKFKNPNDLFFYRTPKAKLQEAIKAIAEHPEKAEEILKEYKINPQQQPEQEAKPTYYKEEELPWDKLGKIGIFKEKIPADDLPNILNGNGSKYMYPVKIDFGDIKLETDAKFSVWKNKDDKIIVSLKGKVARQELDHYFNIKFNATDKENLETTGNLGRIAEVQFSKNSNPEKVYISQDHLTNRLVSFKASSLRLHDEAFGVDIKKHHETLKNGGIVHLKGMKRKDGSTFDGDIQVNAETRGVALVSYRKPPKMSNTIGGKDLSEENQIILKDGGTIFLQGLVCHDGSIRDGYFNIKNNKTRFYDANDPNSLFLAEEVIKSKEMYNNKYGVKTQDNPANKEEVPLQNENNKQRTNKETIKPPKKGRGQQK